MALREEIVESQKARCDLLKWKLVLVAALGATGLGLGEKGGAGSGLLRHVEYVLCLIPLVCVYVDLLSKHMTLRILVIGRYKECAAGTGEKGGDDDIEYERFAQQARAMELPSKIRLKKEEKKAQIFKLIRTESLTKLRNKKEQKDVKLNAYDLEEWALQWSTLLLSLLVSTYGLIMLFIGIGRVMQSRSQASASIYKLIMLDSYIISMLPLIFFGLLGIAASLWVECEYKLRLMAIEKLSLDGKDKPPVDDRM